MRRSPLEAALEQSPDLGLIEDARRQHEASLRIIPPNESVIGGYHIVRVIGRGGMGVVYEAEQASPGRRVALKVIRHGAHIDPLHMRRFRREVRALGRLQHPWIATIFEAGISSDGQHFLAMELVDGTPLRRFLQLPSATDDQKLALFCKVCEAIEYAHDRGVLHLDLKPSNILVDSRGDPKVLDFGLARIMDGDADSGTGESEAAAPSGTPLYMSPERLLQGNRIANAQCDVYSLGVILREILTGSLPQCPSVGDQTESSGGIGPRAAGPSQGLGDLPSPWAAIVARSLDADPQERYGCVADLAQAVRKVVHPGSSTAGGVARTAGRTLHRVAGLFLAITMMTGTALALFLASQSRQDSNADRPADPGASGRIVESAWANPPLSPGRQTALGTLDSLTHAVDHRSLSLEDAVLQSDVGTIYLSVGRYDEAARLLESAMARQEKILGPSHPLVADTASRLAAVHRSSWNLGPVAELYQRSLAILTHAGEGDPTDLARLRQRLAESLALTGRFTEAILIVEEACAALRQAAEVLGPPVRASRGQREALVAAATSRVKNEELARCMLALGNIHNTAGNLDAATSAFQEAAELCENEACGPGLMVRISLDRSWNLHAQGDLLGARELRRRALQWGFSQGADDYSLLTAPLLAAAQVSSEIGDFDDAERLFAQTRAILRQALDEDDPAVLDVIGGLAGLYWSRGEYDESERLMRYRVSVEEAKPGAATSIRYALALNSLGVVLRDQGDLEAAEPLIKTALDITAEVFGPEHRFTSNSLINLSRLELLRGNLSRAWSLADRCLRIRGGMFPREHLDIAEALLVYGMITTELGRPEEALPGVREALETRSRVLPPDHWLVAEAKGALARCLIRAGRAPDAEPLLREAAVSLATTVSPEHRLVRHVNEQLARFSHP